jgi:putative hydrolase of the HAD superfamily
MNIVFDFGAVVFSWHPHVLLAEVFPEHAATPQKAGALAHAIFGHADWHDFDRGVLTPAQVAERTAGRLVLELGAVNAMVDAIIKRLVPMPASVALLEDLLEQRDAQRGVQGVYFLSNMPAPYARVLERRHGFLKRFDGGVFSADVGLIKPDPAIYQLLQTRYALEPQRIFFIDDLHANVQVAHDLGWGGVQFESAAQVRQSLARVLAP